MLVVLNPDLDRRCRRQAVRSALSARGKFFYMLRRSARLQPDGEAGAHLGKAELLQRLAVIALVIVDAEALGDDALRSIRRQRTTQSTSVRPPLDDLRQLIQLFRRQARRRTVRPAVRSPHPDQWR